MEGGGYCGIQEHPDGRNFIFSIWDPINSSDPISASYTHPGTQIESFGGEGTGLKSWNFNIGWDTNQWYSFVTRAWSIDSNTMFGFWVYNHSDQIWHHLVTMDYPVNDIRFNSSTGSFIEDWLGNGSNMREVHHQNAWKRKTSDLSWSALTSSLFERVSPDAGANNYIDNYNGGTNNDYYFMQSGGTATPSNSTSGTMLSLINFNSEPGYDVAVITNINKTVSMNNLLLNWTLDSSKSPQFSYEINVYDNPNFSGVPLIEIDEIIPHQREVNIDISSLFNDEQYYIEFNVIDIFDNKSATLTENFVAQSSNLGLNDVNVLETYDYYPNPFENKIHLDFKKQIEFIEIRLTDITGKTILKNSYNTISELEINTPTYMSKGIYFITLTDKKQNINTIKLIKK
ncbi:hypothetical protein GCM10010831_24680 [Psychroflexus salis]|uniref:Secretion system C-terminal sorting domain-containing protein n=2 Tax=Psychroflexus salis TaxID=1526574 RepID=A0A917A1S9_9FLAO|nr:hypothetical protein GCM10010831_24680 [Psychroflexus salis]